MSLNKIKNFFLFLKIFYWFSLKAIFRSWREGDTNRTQLNWSKYLFEWLKVRIVKDRSSKELRREKTVFLVNHRSQADFFIHDVLLDFTASFLSRMMVAVLFIWTGFFVRKTTWFFNRSAHVDPEKFNQWLDRKFDESPRQSFLVYPEGHRMPNATNVAEQKLKTGMIKYAFRRKIPVQMLMSFGNEHVMNQKKLDLNFGVPVTYSFSNVFNPNDYEDEKQFVQQIKKEFVVFFDKIYEIHTKQTTDNKSNSQSERLW